MSHWAPPPIDRNQTQLFSPTLDEMIGEDHPVRLFEELLLAQDWSKWESGYSLHRGQPPIHPRVIAGVILYCLGRKLTSSRDLEDGCANRIDVMWLTGGRRIDHSTFAKFRNTHNAALIKLFSGVCKVARQLGMIRLEEVATDGTRIQADSSRNETRSAVELEQWIATLEGRIEEALSEMADNDDKEDVKYGKTGSSQQLPVQLRGLVKRKERVEKAYQEVLSIEKAREEKREAHPDRVAKVSVSDSEARILKNKEGGYAPNYTPVATTDGEAGFIVSQGVTNSTAEYPFQKKALSDIQETFGESPDYMLGDGLYTDLDTVRYLESRGVTPLAPAKSTGAVKGDPAYRENPKEAVLAERVSELPITKKTQLFTRKAFMFDVTTDSFYCPMGKRLAFRYLTNHKRSSTKTNQTRVYYARKKDCAGCSLRDRCISKKTKYRRVERMNSSEVLDNLAKRMEQEENKERYTHRKRIAETPFAHIKWCMGIRRFRHRGLEKVRTEWNWICTAYNLNKLVRLLVARRTLTPLREAEL